jgi:hypothetical protein
MSLEMRDPSVAERDYQDIVQKLTNETVPIEQTKTDANLADGSSRGCRSF